jgi:hypothetical protein
MTSPEGGGWIAKSFTRARVIGMYVGRVALGDKSIDLPVVLNRTQLGALVIGLLVTAVAWVVGKVLGIAGPLAWTFAALTVAVVVMMRFVPTPERGAAFYLEGYLRAARGLLPFASTMKSSRRRPARRRTVHVALRMRENQPVREHAAARHLYEG